MKSGRPDLRLAIAGNSGGTNIGESLKRAATSAGHSVVFFDSYSARGPRVLRSLSWRLLDRRPTWIQQFSRKVSTVCAEARVDLLIATGSAPLLHTDLRQLQRSGVLCVNYSTDDPWNPGLRSEWHLRALPCFDIVFTTRRANIDGLRAIGCSEVRHLPFGFDEGLFHPPQEAIDAAGCDVLFVGGADRDRVEFMREFLRPELKVALVGDYWGKFPQTRRHAAGFKTPLELNVMTSAAKVNLCLVRRANRDGHVMRSFEIAGSRGCMLAEDTEEHRGIFGPDGEAVLYFRNPGEAAERAAWLLARPAERKRLAAAAHLRAGGSENTYGARLGVMLDAAIHLRDCVTASPFVPAQ